MAVLNLATLNARGLRNSGDAARVLGDLRDLEVDIAALQETHFICRSDEHVFDSDYVVVSSYGDYLSRGVSLLVKRSLGARIDVVSVGSDGRCVVVDVAVRDCEFRVVAVYAPNRARERRVFFSQLGSFLTDPKQLVLVGDWNAILDPKIDRGRGASGSVGWQERSLIDFVEKFDLVDRYRLDHPGEEMWTWTNSAPSVNTLKFSYIDRMLVRRADSDFLTCPEFNDLGHADHKFGLARLLLGTKASLANYWKFNSSILESPDFCKKLEGFIQRALVGAVTGNKWWVSLKCRIRTFTIKYCQQLALDKAKMRKSLENRISRAAVGGDSLDVGLARSDLQRLNSERYEGQVVRARLNRVSNEAVNVDAEMRQEEIRRFPERNIKEIKTPDGDTRRTTNGICNAFREHLAARFTRIEALPVEDFQVYLADFPRLEAADAARLEGVITESEVRAALRTVSTNKSPGLDGLPYEMYLRLSHLFVPILTDMFNHWFAQGSIPGQVSKGLITLIQKKDTQGGELDDYRPITLLNTELKILTRILASRLRIVMDYLVDPEQTYALQGRSIQNNLHLIRTVLEGIEDDTCAALINLDQSKAFDRVDHRFLGAVLEAAGFGDGFRAWISILYRSPTARVRVNGKCSESFALSRSVRQGCPLSPLLYCLALEPLLRRLRDGGRRGVLLPGGARARNSAYADDVSVFVSSHEDILAVLQALDEYERITGAKINRSKSKGLRLGAWRRLNPPGPFEWTNGPIKILGIWFGPDLQLELNWSEVQAKVEGSVQTWLRRRLSLKGRAEACATYVFPMILYRLSVIPLPRDRLKALERLLFTLLWKKATKAKVLRKVCYQRIREGGLGMPDILSHLRAERLSFLIKTMEEEPAWAHKVLSFFPRLSASLTAECRRRPRGQPDFIRECRDALRRISGSLTRFSDLSRSTRRALYHALVEADVKDPLWERLEVDRAEAPFLFRWAPASGFLTNYEFSVTWSLIRGVIRLNDWLAEREIVNSPACARCNMGWVETAEHAFFHCSKVRSLWRVVNGITARIDAEQLIQLDICYVIFDFDPPLKGEKRMVFRAILAIARMVIWTTRQEQFCWGASLSNEALVRFFKHQLRVRIRVDSRRLSPVAFRRRWNWTASLINYTGTRWDFDDCIL